MSVTVDRRLLLKGATLGLGVLSVPGGAQLLGARGFTHNVASGEPGHREVMLWTRYVPAAGDAARIRFEVARSADFGSIVTSGETMAGPERDWCVKPVAEGLDPGAWYFYRFVDANGRSSPVGRTRTLPNGSVQRFALGVFSCSNLPFGHFNAYAHAAARDDLHLMVHLGDYLYEYPPGTYPPAEQALAGRMILPDSETVALADYRLRYASYRSDPDLQRLHQLFPMVMMWDDHESANDSWKDGAENHQPGTEGDWAVRKAAAMRAAREWLPVSDEAWTSYRIGDLAHIFRPETRLTGRTQPLRLDAFLHGKEDTAAALVSFRDGLWRDEARTILGIEQEDWLADGFRRSVADGVKWQVLAQQVVMGSMSLSPEIVAFVSNEASEEVRRRAHAGLAASKAGLPFNLDMWDGYPAARERLLRSSREADANLIVLSGDSHNAWAFELEHDREPAGAEFAVQSVTSTGFESHVPADPRDVARAIVAHNPQLKWADTAHRGYLTVELTPERATGEWLFLDTVRRRSTALAGRHSMHVPRGTNRFD